MQLSEFGIDGGMLKWINNFLVDREIQVRVESGISDPHTLGVLCKMSMESVESQGAHLDMKNRIKKKMK